MDLDHLLHPGPLGRIDLLVSLEIVLEVAQAIQSLRYFARGHATWHNAPCINVQCQGCLALRVAGRLKASNGSGIAPHHANLAPVVHLGNLWQRGQDNREKVTFGEAYLPAIELAAEATNQSEKGVVLSVGGDWSHRSFNGNGILMTVAQVKS
jgi:hypothetical protein